MIKYALKTIWYIMEKNYTKEKCIIKDMIR